MSDERVDKGHSIYMSGRVLKAWGVVKKNIDIVGISVDT